MRKILCVLAAFAMLFGLVNDGFSQMNRQQIKKNNRRLMSYRGKKFGFGKEKRYDAIGITLNALNYYGDLAPRPKKLSTDLAFTRPAVGICYTHRFGPRYTLLASFMYGTLKGSDIESADKNDSKNGVFRYQRNLSFRNRIKELSVVAVFDLFENQSTYISRVKWTPYASLGVAVFHHNPQAQVPRYQVPKTAADVTNPIPMPNAGEWVDLQPLGTEGQYADLQPGDANYGIKPYKRIQVAIPFSIGARFRLNEVMDLSAEFGFRYLFTDYIDDVSKNYVDLGVFGNDELAKAMSYRSFELNPANTWESPSRDGTTYYVIHGYGEETKDNVRGNHNDKDIYTVLTFRLTYIVGKSILHRAKFR